MGLDLLWRNGVKPENVVMGFGFYGHSFTMRDATCHDPNAGCQFASAGLPGDCSASAGILTYAEIQSRNESLNSDTYYDAETTTKYMTYLSDQWISYDDDQSFTDKKRFMTSQCLSGLMIWAVDQDTQNYDALHALLGDAAMEDVLTRGGELSNEQKEKLSNEFASFTGQNYFVTELCTDGSNTESGLLQLCPAGTSLVSTAHAPLQMTGEYGLVGQCSTGWYRHICCPNNQMPTNCEWNGEPVCSSISYTRKCGSNQFELSTDTYLDAEGEGECFQGHRSLCCDSTELLNQCFWSGCQGPLNPTQPIGEIDTEGCPRGYESLASCFDTDDGGWCSNEFNSNLHDQFKQGLCCPKSKGFNRCEWTMSDLNGAEDGETSIYDPSKASWEPAPMNAQLRRRCINGHCTVGEQCSAYPILPEYDSKFYLCCDPPSEYDENWPVPPSWLWEDAYKDEADDVAWAFANNQGNNNRENNDDPVEEDPSDQAYGFLMLDGPPESIDNAFGDTYTVARRSTRIDPSIKRRGSPECEKVFMKGAEDTIIKLPVHIGEGPFARIVSMEPASESYQLPQHHIRARALDENDSPIFRVKFDYNFHLIRCDDGPVNMRIDYTNLLPYWDEVTHSDPAARKRSFQEPMSQSECSQRGYYTEMKMYLDADVSLDATYAYYLSGTIERPQTGLEPQFYASAQASAALAINVSPNARLGIEVGPSVLGSGNLVDAQIITFMNTTLEFKATVQGSLGTSTDPSYSYEYGAYSITIWGMAGMPISWAGMKYTIYHNDNVESDTSLNSKRDLHRESGFGHDHDTLNELSEPSVFDDTDKTGINNVIKPYKAPSLPPKQLRHNWQKSVQVVSSANDWRHANTTSLTPRAGSLFYKQADDGDPPMPDADAAASAQFFNHQYFTCPARGLRDPILPDFRYNCKVFSAIQAQANGNSRLVRGICDGILGYLGQRALPTGGGGLVLTWDPNCRTERDAYSCNLWGNDQSSCTAQDKELRADLGITSSKYIISCDEFLFGGVEEGSDFEILSSLYTNVAYYDRDAGDTTSETWKKWSTGGDDNTRWTPGGSMNDRTPPAFGRLTCYYDQVMPLSHNIDADEWEDTNYKLSYNMKRNFTFGVAYGTSLDKSADQWGSMRIQDYTLVTEGTTGTDPLNVFCAINLYNQPDVYRFDKYNGMCYSEKRSKDALGFGRRPGYARCKVNFVSSLFNDHPTPGTWSKRSNDPVTGRPEGRWEIENKSEILSWLGFLCLFTLTAGVEIDPDPAAWMPLPEDEFPFIPDNLFLKIRSGRYDGVV
ncbi:hypothetical protein BDV12DRAFT_205062 [Aspergillus spectabilis]